MSQRAKKITAYCFLIAFILIKASGLHAFAHNHHVGDPDHCALCQISSRDAATPLLLFAQEIDFSVFLPLYFPEFSNHYENITSEQPEVCELFNTSPPFYTI